jgi:allophanate hydrolase
MSTTRLDIASLFPRLVAGDLTPREVIDDVMRRIDAYPDPAVWIHRMSREHIERQLEELQARKAAGGPLPLYGVPFAVKDNIDVAGEPTTAGCPDFAYVPRRSATVVDRLLNAGAVLVGKTNMDQFATGLVGTRSPYGACRNVFDPRYISGGSSSGSGVAVAAGLVSFALGTDTAGSGRVPAAFNDIVGLKPTRGLVSTAGVVPACRTLDCVSVFARTPADAAAVLDVIDGYDPADPFARPVSDPARQPCPTRMVGRNGRLRIGSPPPDELEFFGDDDARAVHERALRMVDLMGERVTVDYTPFAATARLLYEGPWVAERVAAIADFYRRSPQSLLPVTRAIFETSKQWDAASTFRAFYDLAALRRQTEAAWAAMDVMVLPTTGTIYSIDQVEADPISLNTNLGHYTNFVNLLDLCAIAVPAGFRADGLPAGITLLAPAGSDRNLCAIAQAFMGSRERPR